MLRCKELPLRRRVPLVIETRSFCATTRLKAKIMPQLKPFEFDDAKRINLREAAKSYRADLEKAAQVDADLRSRMQVIFGADPFCPDWDHDEAKPLTSCDGIYSRGWATLKILKTNQKEILLFHCVTLVTAIFTSDVLRFVQNKPAALFRLKGRLEDDKISMIALFRAELVWPLWGSSQAFWEDLVRIFDETSDSYNYYWPKRKSCMTSGQVKEFFESIGCVEGLRLIKVIIALEGEDFDLTNWPNHFSLIAQ